MLKTRRFDRLPNDQDFANALRIFSKCNEANAYNTEELRKSNSPVIDRFNAKNCRQAEKVQADLAGNLESVLYVTIGSRVMLRRNLLTSVGLVNGEIRTITDIVVDPNKTDMPLCIMVRFDNYSGTTINGSVPIAPVEATWRSENRDCTRLQFSILLSFEITIHKSQGYTLNNVVVDLGKHETNLGMAYVALSRVKTLGGLALAKPYDFTRYTEISGLNSLRQRKNEESRLMSISL